MAKVAVIPQINVRFRIPNISDLKQICSPEYLVQGIPWKVVACKLDIDGSSFLSLFLTCENNDNGPENWSFVAFVTFKLLRHNDQNGIEKSTGPCIFDEQEPAFGDSKFISWDDLFNVENNFVTNDTIDLDVKIEAADPREIHKCNLNFEELERSCEDGCLTTHRITLNNIDKLIAVRSPIFEMRRLKWELTFYKSRSGNLAMSLGHKGSSDDVSCEMRLWTKLISFKQGVEPVERIHTGNVQRVHELYIKDLMPWNGLLEPQNGFIENDSIVIVTEIKAGKPQGVPESIAQGPIRIAQVVGSRLGALALSPDRLQENSPPPSIQDEAGGNDRSPSLLRELSSNCLIEETRRQRSGRKRRRSPECLLIKIEAEDENQSEPEMNNEWNDQD